MDNSDGIEASATGKVLGQSITMKVAGTWAPPAILTAAALSLLIWGDPQHDGQRMALFLVLVLLGVTFGVSFTSKRVEDWKAIAAERSREIARMAEEKNSLVALKARGTSDPRKGQGR